MSAVTVAVLVGFVCCALFIRALQTQTGNRADTTRETGRLRSNGLARQRAMMDE